MSKPNKPKSLYIVLPEQVHRAAKAVAALEGRQLGEVVTDAISAYVESRFPQLGGNLGSPKSLGNPKNSTNPKEPKLSGQAPATTPGYVPLKSVVDDELDVSEELPPARDGENPFADEDD